MECAFFLKVKWRFGEACWNRYSNFSSFIYVKIEIDSHCETIS